MKGKKCKIAKEKRGTKRRNEEKRENEKNRTGLNIVKEAYGINLK